MALVDLQLRPDRRRLRQFGWIAAGICLVLSGLVLWRGRLSFWDFAEARTPMAGALSGIAVLSLLFSWKWPNGNRPLYVGLSLISYPIGLVVANLMIAVIFYCVFTPLGLLFRLIGRDALHRGLDRGAATYWIARERERRRSRYFQQF